MKERDQPDPLKKRQACEKGWLAVTEAVDKYLAQHGIHIPEGQCEAHTKRITALGNLVKSDPAAEKLYEKIPVIADTLHGACFYGGEDSPQFDVTLKRTVREILELKGFPLDGEE